MEYFSVLKSKEILTQATTWLNFENIVLGEISQMQKDKYESTYMRYLDLAN